VVVPTSVDVGRYVEASAAEAATRAGAAIAGEPIAGDAAAGLPSTAAARPTRVTLGWIGTPSTSRYLPLLEEPLRAVAAKHDIDIRLVGAGDTPFQHLPVTLRPWSLATEAREIAAFDIGLMPMPDTAWTRGKAALKALQYGAAGIPTIASWTPTNEQILGVDEGTIYCRTGDEWRAALERLMGDDVLRAELGRRARRRVDASYSVSANLPKLIAVLHA
jgi:glycosyltransferase involved in cell wall biosynthesis